MKGKILITDTLFIEPEHEGQIRDAGYEIERLNKSEATEDELVEAVKGKIGYILGGIEKVTDKIIGAGVDLKAIVFTGIAYKDFITGWEKATEKGVAIANTPDGPTYAVAEWAITMALAMNRNIFDLGRIGDKKFLTTPGIENQQIGIVGLGRIGSQIGEIIRVFRPASVSYWNRTRKLEKEKELSINYSELPDLLNGSDIVFVCLSKDVGENFIGEKELKMMKNNALLLTFMHSKVIDEVALLHVLQEGRIRAVSDYPAKSSAFNDLPMSRWYSFNASNAFNTASEIKLVSDMATQSLLNLLETGEDNNKVN